jgi:hydroxymethylpyrimidine kinase/phosphomethylpyrimidine kinase
MEAACRHLQAKGARNVVVTGGHLETPTDVLGELRPDGSLRFHKFPGERIETRNTHGTGCAFSTAIACRLASGDRLAEAVFAAKVFVASALREAYRVGKGAGPINHFWRYK